MHSNFSHLFSSFKKSFRFDNPLQIIVSHLLYPRGKILYVWKGKPIIVDGKRAETTGGIHAVLGTTEYSQFFDKAGPGRIRNLLDLGANVGSFTLLAQDRFPNLKRVILVEGDESVLPRLQFNIYESLDRSAATIIHSAVCGHDGEITFYQNASSVGSGTTADSAGNNAVAMTVPAISLASLIGQFPSDEAVDFCKMDIEGSEFPAIYSLSDDQLYRLKFIVAELHGTDQENQALISHFISKGYQHHPSDLAGNGRTHGFSFSNS